MFSTSTISIKHKLLSFAACALLVSIAIPATAAVEHIVENGILIGANNVDVGGALYNVRFVDGTIDSVFQSKPIFLGDPLGAWMATSALSNSVFTDSVRGLFDSRVDNSNGCSADYVCLTLTPHTRSTYLEGSRGDYYSSTYFANYSDETYDSEWSGEITLSRNDDTRPYLNANYAVWSLTTIVAVPEPSTYAMMGLGLLGVMRMARRRQKQD